jgi:hypothetical protein
MAINFVVGFAVFMGVMWLEHASGIWSLLDETVAPRLTLSLINAVLTGLVVGVTAIFLRERRTKRNRFTAPSDG